MNQMGFNVLKRAQDSTKINNSLCVFFKQRGIDIKQVENDPKYYEELMMEYSRECINTGLFEESKAHMEDEFNRLCEFHRRNEEELVRKFFAMTKENFLKQNKQNNQGSI